MQDASEGKTATMLSQIGKTACLLIFYWKEPNKQLQEKLLQVAVLPKDKSHFVFLQGMSTSMLKTPQHEEANTHRRLGETPSVRF